VDRRGGRVGEYDEEPAEDAESDPKQGEHHHPDHIRSVEVYVSRSELVSALRQVDRLMGRPGESQTMRLTSGNAVNHE
jgi:hypothetical protein